MKAVNISFEGTEAQKIACESGMKFVFDASVGEAEFTRDGNDLVISKGGVAIVLTSFYDVYNKDEQPSFEIDGMDIDSADFFQAMNVTDLQPAAATGGSRGCALTARTGRRLKVGGVHGLEEVVGVDVHAVDLEARLLVLVVDVVEAGQHDGDATLGNDEVIAVAGELSLADGCVKDELHA